ncbi:MAG: hypothetical protein AAGJ10_02530 [Bacteroidota bacterium]
MHDASLEQHLREHPDWPAEVVDWHVEHGLDATGEDAVWVWATLAVPMADADTRAELRHLIRNRVTAHQDPDPYWVYVRFRAADELVAE